MILRLDEKEMDIHPKAWIADSATLVGEVVLKENANVWYNAVLRADCGPIIIGEGTAVEDNCVLHEKVRIGKNCLIGHGAILHGCTVGDNVLIGMGSTVLDGAVIGDGAAVAAGALVTKGTIIPPGCMAMGVPAKIRGEVTPELLDYTVSGAAGYVRRAEQQLSCGHSDDGR